MVVERRLGGSFKRNSSNKKAHDMIFVHEEKSEDAERFRFMLRVDVLEFGGVMTRQNTYIRRKISI